MTEPDEVPKIIKKLKERKGHLEEVKESYLNVQRALPYVQQNLDLTDWQLNVYENLPPEASEIPIFNRSDSLDAENQYLKGLYHVAHVPPLGLLNSTASVTTSGTSTDYSYVNRVRDLATPAALEYGNAFILQYQNIQETQDRPKQVRDLLGKINTTNIYKRFDSAFEAFQGYKSGSVKRTAAANEIRNLLSGLKGDLLNKARKWPKENMNWNNMSARLAINGGRGQEYVILGAEESKHASLLVRLADVLKDREGGSVTDLESIWTEVLDHLYTVLGLLA
jgi:hypothetical protein